MRVSTKVLLIVAASLVVLGLLTVAVAFAALRFDFKGIFAANYESVTHEVSEDFESISIKTDTADIVFLPSEDDTCKVVCKEQKKLNHSVRVEDGVLCVDIVDTRKWYDHISLFSIGESGIKVYLPKSEYDALSIYDSTGDIKIPSEFGFNRIDAILSTGDIQCYSSAKEYIKIKTSTGDILVSGANTTSLELSTSTGEIDVERAVCEGDVRISVSTGDAELHDVTCKNLISYGNTGDIDLSGVIAEESFSIERSTGEVELERCDAADIYIKTDTGDVSGSLLSEKVFIVNTDTGKTNVPQTTAGGRCEIITDTGDIEIIID